MNDILITPIGLLSNFVAFKRAICPITTTLFLTHYIYYVGSRDEDTWQMHNILQTENNINKK